MSRSASGEESLGRSTIFSLLAEVLRVAATATLTLYLVRALGPTEYGTYSLALGIGVLLLIVSDFGVSMSTSRFVADNLGDASATAGVVRDGLRITMVIASAAAAGLIALAGPIASAYSEPGLAEPLRAVALVTLAQTVFQVLVSTSIGMRRNSLQARLYAIEGFTETCTAITLVALGGGAAAALLGRSIGFLVAVAFGAAMIVRLLGRRALPGRRGAGHARRILGYARSTLVLNASFALFNQIDVLLITAYLTITEAGYFQAPGRLILLVLLVGQAVSNAVAPRAASDTPAQAARTLAGALRLLIVIGAIATTALMVWSEPIVQLALGDQYARSADVLLARGPFVLLAIVGPLITVSLNYLGHARRRVPIAVATLGLQAVLDVLLIPRWGIVGPAVASNIAYALYLGAHLRILAKVVDLDLRSLARTTLRTLAAAAAMAGVLALAGTGERLSVLEWLAGGAGGLAAFGLVLAATGEVRRGDLAGARTWWRNRRASS